MDREVYQPVAGRWRNSRSGVPGGARDTTQGWRLRDHNPELMKGLSEEPLQELTVPSPLPDDQNIMPKNLKPISAYNWIDERIPTILVPGCPPIWQNRPTPFKLRLDSGGSFIDQNRFRVRKYPLLPLFVAVEHQDRDYEFKQIDLITDRNNLRKLVRWIEGSIQKDFRIDVETLGKSTVVFTRYDFPFVEEQSQVFGYGRNFEKYTTRLLNGCERSTGHHRIISYTFGKLKVMVRFEVDACMHYDSETQFQPASASHTPSRRSSRSSADDVDSLVSQLGGLAIGNEEIVVEKAGLLVKQETLVEMTTRSARRIREGSDFDWEEYFPQLFFSQTPFHCLGVHESGQFRRIDIRVLRDETLHDAQRKQQDKFDRLHALLLEIRDRVKEIGPGRRLALVYRTATKKLEVFERPESNACLPPKWMERFEEEQAQSKFEQPESNEETGVQLSRDATTSSTALAIGDDAGDSDNSTIVKGS